MRSHSVSAASFACAVAVTATLGAGVASAHISIASGLAGANATQEVVFGVGHGCSGADTYRVRIEIPAGVTSARPMTSDFGKATVEKDAAGTTTAVVWQKADADALDGDTNYYKLTIRLKTPDQPFTTLFFKATQTCRAADGTLSTVDWAMLPTDPVVDGGSTDEPAPTLALVPAHRLGWNKLVAPVAVTDLATFFSDAQIVWVGAAAFSPNAATADMIKATAGVSALGAIAAGDIVWVRY